MSSKQSSSKSDSRVAKKDIIVTRHKSAQMKRQLRTKNRSMKHLTDLLKSPAKETLINGPKNVQAKPKSPKIKESLLKSVAKVQKLPEKVFTLSKMLRKKIALMQEEEYYPNKVKRKMDVKKVMLKPSHELQMVGSITGSVKRKSSKPHKATSKRPKQARSPVYAELSMAEVIRMFEDELTDEDMMEILTCPSPVWWEDPPDEEYIEDAIFTQPPKKAPEIKKKEHVQMKKEVDVPTSSKESIQAIEMPNLTSKSDKFLKKRSKLEGLLGNIKKCGNKVHQSKKYQFNDDVVIICSNHRKHNDGDAADKTKSKDKDMNDKTDEKISNDKPDVLNKTKSSNDKPNVSNRTKSSNDTPDVSNRTKSSNDTPDLINNTKISNDKPNVINKTKSSSDKPDVINKTRSSSDDNALPIETKPKNDKRGRLSESDCDEILFSDNSMNEDELLRDLENMAIPIENHIKSDVIVIDDDEDLEMADKDKETKSDISPTKDKEQAPNKIFKPKKITKMKSVDTPKNLPVSQISIGSPKSSDSSDSKITTTTRDTNTVSDTRFNDVDEKMKNLSKDGVKLEPAESKDVADSSCVTVYKIIEEMSDPPTADVKMETSKPKSEDKDDKSATINDYYKKCKKVYTKKSKKNVDKTDINKNDVNLKNDVKFEMDVCEACKPKVKKVSDDKNVKYCLKCSSIFDSTDCTYCIEKSKAQIFTCITCSKKFCCETNYRKHSAHGAHHSNDVFC